MLGEHRLVQGDAREANVYTRLSSCRARRPRSILTDQPYNVPNVGHVTGNVGHREFAMANGEMTYEQFVDFNCDWMSAALAHLWRRRPCSLASSIGARSGSSLQAGRDLGLSLLNIVVWAKTNGGQGSLWRSEHELLPVFKQGEASHINNVELGRHGRWRRTRDLCQAPRASAPTPAMGLTATRPRNRERCSKTRCSTSQIGAILSSTASLARDRRSWPPRRSGAAARAIEIDGAYCDLGSFAAGK